MTTIKATVAVQVRGVRSPAAASQVAEMVASALGSALKAASETPSPIAPKELTA